MIHPRAGIESSIDYDRGPNRWTGRAARTVIDSRDAKKFLPRAVVRKHLDQSRYSSPINMHVPPPLTSAAVMANNMAISAPLRSVRFAATSAASLLQLLKDANDRVNRVEIDHRVIREAERAESAPCEFDRDDQFRAMILFASADQLPQRLAAAAKAAEAGKDFAQCWIANASSCGRFRHRLLALHGCFPGQGSHYPETPSVLSASESRAAHDC